MLQTCSIIHTSYPSHTHHIPIPSHAIFKKQNAIVRCCLLHAINQVQFLDLYGITADSSCHLLWCDTGCRWWFSSAAHAHPFAFLEVCLEVAPYAEFTELDKIHGLLQDGTLLDVPRISRIKVSTKLSMSIASANIKF